MSAPLLFVILAGRVQLDRSCRHRSTNQVLRVPLSLLRRVLPYFRYFGAQNDENRAEHGGTIIKVRLVLERPEEETAFPALGDNPLSSSRGPFRVLWAAQQFVFWAFVTWRRAK